MATLPRGPWLELSIDFCGPLPTGEYLLVIIDEFSRFPVVEVVRSTSAETVIPVVDNVFSLLGYPEIVKSDNGPPFNGYLWKAFMQENGIRHRKITPLWPQANAQAEAFNNPLMKSVRSASISGSEKRNAKVSTRVSMHSPPNNIIHASSTDVRTRSTNKTTRSQAARVGG